MATAQVHQGINGEVNVPPSSSALERFCGAKPLFSYSSWNILPVINKIDLPSADIPKTKEEIQEMLGLDASEAAEVSGKTGQGIKDMLEKVVKDIPAPSGDITAPLKALIFDSKYDDYRGVVMSVKIEDGAVKPGDKIQIMNTGKEYEVTEVGVSSPQPVKKDILVAGDVGYLTANIK